MNKTKIVKKKDMSYLWLNGQKGQQLNMREIESLKNREIDGLFPVLCSERRKTFRLTFNVTGYTTLAKHLENPLSRTEFAFLLGNIYEIMKNMEDNFFHYQNLLVEHKHIYINPATKRVSLVYVPIQYENNQMPLKSFFLSITDKVKFSPGEDTSYLKELVELLNRGVNFSLFDLEEYIKRISGKHEDKKNSFKCAKCGTDFFEKIKYCPACGNNMISEKSTAEIIYNPLGNPHPATPDVQAPATGGETSGTQHSNTYTPSPVKGDDIGGTTLLVAPDDEERTDILGSQRLAASPPAPVYPYLIREKNNEKIVVNKPSFRIGKEKKYSDYFVGDNPVVSRSHADIITKNGRFFIVDNNSLNKTLLNGDVISPSTEVELFEATKISLANENFTFHIV